MAATTENKIFGPFMLRTLFLAKFRGKIAILSTRNLLLEISLQLLLECCWKFAIPVGKF